MRKLIHRFIQVVSCPHCGPALPLLFAGVLTGIASTGVVATTSNPTEMSSVLTSADNGRTIELHVGAEAALRLPENPSTGYRWAVDAADPSLVRIEERGYLATSEKIGAPGEAQWLMKAKVPGATEIKLKRWRQWEGERSVVERFEIKLRVSA
jgi:inhibitor of cysteine peptidase